MEAIAEDGMRDANEPGAWSGRLDASRFKVDQPFEVESESDAVMEPAVPVGLADSRMESSMTSVCEVRGLSSRDRAVGIAADVLVGLLPDDESVELPEVERVNGGIIYRALKRIFDVCACSLALAIMAVPMLVIAARIRRESPGPVIYAQEREGLNGKPFRLYKFRSMYSDAEERGARWAASEDPRVTPYGMHLRRTRLDEVPQFWNVVRGDMSLVGPRPERPVFCEAFRERIKGWDQRTLVRPGITGLAQVDGGYELLPKEKAKLDIEYIESRSIILDLKIMLKTVGVLKSGEGAR